MYFNATLLDPSLKNIHFRSDKNAYKTIKTNFEDALKPFEKSSEVATQVEATHVGLRLFTKNERSAKPQS